MDTAKKSSSVFLTCEKKWIYHVLIAVAGFFGAYTYLLRGNVFCNAQTGNVVLMAMALGSCDIRAGIYYLIPISAYVLGTFLSELLPNPLKRAFSVRWDTILILIEMISVIILGFVPDSAPVQISQVVINFIASMQYNTFRQAEGVPMATTFATNHIRQIGIGLAKELRHRNSPDKEHRLKLGIHFVMLLFFLGGAIIGTIFCNLFSGRAIWITVFPFAFIFIRLLYADLISERDMIDRKPSGH